MSKLTAQEIIEKLRESEISVNDFAYDEIPYDKDFSTAALKAQEEKDSFYEKNKTNEFYKTEAHKIYSNMPSKYQIAQKEWLLKNNIPSWKEVEQYGGEGKGDTWYSVKYFKDYDVYLRINGWYQSHNGTDFNGWEDVEEVRPQQKTITVYE